MGNIDYGQVGAGMALDAAGSVVNNLNNELQMERTFGYNERAAKNADARTRALFTDLYSPEAKVQQLKDAGLSVGMMYGQGGASGTSSTQGAQGAGAGNQQAAQVNLSKQLELGMMTAQIKALEAGANKDNADAKNKVPTKDLKESPKTTEPDMIRIMAPNGQIKLIPKDKADAALKAGGQMVK